VTGLHDSYPRTAPGSVQWRKSTDTPVFDPGTEG
jgi:hypothetical protein